ncbi:MAG: DUF5674 family protein [Candidatus Margulisiibacteriota bacterium]|nr:DUF5674 family protein [Candidatus Margulisiibacteriota bacterium]
MKIVSNPITLQEIKQMAKSKFGNFVKAVVDIERSLIVLDAELHADEEALLIENGSKSHDLWGINLYPDLPFEDFIEYDSMINLKPSENNRSRGVESPEIREKITQIVRKFIKL